MKIEILCVLVEYLIGGDDGCLNQIINVCKRREGWALIENMLAKFIRLDLGEGIDVDVA